MLVGIVTLSEGAATMVKLIPGRLAVATVKRFSVLVTSTVRLVVLPTLLAAEQIEKLLMVSVLEKMIDEGLVVKPLLVPLANLMRSVAVDVGTKGRVAVMS